MSYVRLEPLSVASLANSQVVSISPVRAGVPAVWKVVGVDLFGNVMTVVPPFEIKIVGSSSGLLNHTSAVLAPGTLMIQVTPKVVETLQISVSLNGNSLAGSPFLFNVAVASVSAPFSHATGLTAHVAASTGVSFALQLRDEFGEFLTSGAAVEFSPPAHKMAVSADGVVTFELGPGSYVVKAFAVDGPWKDIPFPKSFPFFIVASSDSGASVEMISAIAMVCATVCAAIVLVLLLLYRKKMAAPPPPDPQDLFSNTTYEEEE